MRGPSWNLRVRVAETETSYSDVALVFESIVKVTFQTRCLFFKILLKSFCHPKNECAVVNVMNFYTELNYE